jgi:hypothetical protein
VSGSEDKPRQIGPADDPYDFEWPDDAKELRAAEREAARKRALIKPAPRFLTAYLIGTGTVLTLVGGFSLMQQAPEFFASYVAPIAVFGLIAALPLGIILEMLTRGRNIAIGASTFLVVGGLVGYMWTSAYVGWLLDAYPPDAADVSEANGFRTAASVFMMVAVASAFVVAFNTTDRVKMKPRAVWIGFGVLLALFIPSAIMAIQDLSTLAK